MVRLFDNISPMFLPADISGSPGLWHHFGPPQQEPGSSFKSTPSLRPLWSRGCASQHQSVAGETTCHRKIVTAVENIATPIARFMGPTWGPSGADRAQVGPCWPHQLCYLGRFTHQTVASFTKDVNPRLAKRPLKTNGRLAIRGLTSLVKEVTAGSHSYKQLYWPKVGPPSDQHNIGNSRHRASFTAILIHRVIPPQHYHGFWSR